MRKSLKVIDPSELRKLREARLAASDTVIVPAREEGFKQEFLGNHHWMAVRMSPAMKDRVKFIAAYQVAPIGAVTHIAEVQEIRLYKDTGKYQLIFKTAPKAIEPIPPGDFKGNMQGPLYVQRNRCHRSVQNRPVIIDSKPATFMVIRGFEGN